MLDLVETQHGPCQLLPPRRLTYQVEKSADYRTLAGIAAQFNKARVTPTSQPLQMTLVSPEVGWQLSGETCLKEKSCKRGYRSVSNRSQKASKCGIGATVAYGSCSTCSLNAFLRQWQSVTEHCKNWQGVFRAQLLFRSLQPRYLRN